MTGDWLFKVCLLPHLYYTQCVVIDVYLNVRCCRYVSSRLAQKLLDLFLFIFSKVLLKARIYARKYILHICKKTRPLINCEPNLKIEFRVRKLQQYNENFDMHTMDVGSGVPNGLRSKGRGCFLPHLFRTMPSLKLLTQRAF